MLENPFTTHTYRGPEYFCDRNAELSRLIEMFDNRRYGLLYSMRRLGKTGLIHHFHHTLAKRKDTICVYCDVQNTHSDAEFASKLISSAVSAVEQSQQGIIQRVGEFFSSLRPVLTFDPVTHVPSLELSIETGRDAAISLSKLMEMLAELPRRVQIAIDEFQQVGNYERTSVDATLRGYINKVPDVHFLFCGSQQHLLMGLFGDAKSPFFGTVDQMHLPFIDRQVYAEFIARHFRNNNQDIDDAEIDEVLEWTRGHTFYTQYFCNRLFSKGHREIGPYEVEMIKRDTLFAFEPGYLSLRSVLSPNQFKLLKAIALEGSVSGVSSSAFLSKYDMAQSTAQQSLKVLLKKDLLYERLERGGSEIFVYDPFFSRWLETL